MRTFPEWRRGTVENGVHIYVDRQVLGSYKEGTNWQILEAEGNEVSV